jgi:hypothetical protein
MSDRYPNALALSRRVLKTLVVMNVIYGFAILAFLIMTFVALEWTMTAVGVKPAPDRATMVRGMRLIMIVGMSAVPIGHVILKRLLAIVDTVRAGDPFVVENAERLQTIAWSVVGLQLLHILIGLIAANSGTSLQPLDIDWNFSFTPWIAVLLLFVLARVFDHGARMRADLEGTV